MTAVIHYRSSLNYILTRIAALGAMLPSAGMSLGCRPPVSVQTHTSVAVIESESVATETAPAVEHGGSNIREGAAEISLAGFGASGEASHAVVLRPAPSFAIEAVGGGERPEVALPSPVPPEAAPAPFLHDPSGAVLGLKAALDAAREPPPPGEGK